MHYMFRSMSSQCPNVEFSLEVLRGIHCVGFQLPVCLHNTTWVQHNVKRSEFEFEDHEREDPNCVSLTNMFKAFAAGSAPG